MPILKHGFTAIRLVALLALISCSSSPPAHSAVSADSLTGKLVVGYQGWFGCPGDFAGNTHWVHWFNGDIPDAAHLRVEFLPDVTAYPKEALCLTDMKSPTGAPIYVFSSQSPAAVNLHFAWMAQAGIDGAAVQRFVLGGDNPPVLAREDHELLLEKAAAERSGRIFFVTYDVSVARSATVIDQIERDWRHVVNDLGVTKSPNYLRDHGKPVLELWGFGLTSRPGTAAEVGGLVHAFKTGALGVPPVTLVGGVSEGWRTLSGTSQTDPAWAGVYRSFDYISPWFTGRFDSESAAQRYLAANAGADIAETRRLGIGYMPDIFPGFSWSNLMRLDAGRQVPFDQIPRDCGQFEWTQVREALDLGVSAIYVGMFDEVDEGTAIFETEWRPDRLPAGTRMLSPSEGGCRFESAGYLRVTGAAAHYLHSGAPAPARVEDVLPH